MGLMRKVEIKGKELWKGREIKERNEIEKLGNKMCIHFCCDDCVYFNILTWNLDQGAQYFSNSSN